MLAQVLRQTLSPPPGTAISPDPCFPKCFWRGSALPCAVGILVLLLPWVYTACTIKAIDNAARDDDTAAASSSPAPDLDLSQDFSCRRT